MQQGPLFEHLWLGMHILISWFIFSLIFVFLFNYIFFTKFLIWFCVESSDFKNFLSYTMFLGYKFENLSVALSPNSASMGSCSHVSFRSRRPACLFFFGRLSLCKSLWRSFCQKFLCCRLRLLNCLRCWSPHVLWNINFKICNQYSV